MTAEYRAPQGDRLVGMADTPTRVTNEDFAEAIGCHFTMASRLRNGERMPSVTTLSAIVNAYGLDAAVALDQYSKGPAEFSAYLRREVFKTE